MTKTYKVVQFVNEPAKDADGKLIERTIQRVMKVVATGLTWAEAKTKRFNTYHSEITQERA